MNSNYHGQLTVAWQHDESKAVLLRALQLSLQVQLFHGVQLFNVTSPAVSKPAGSDCAVVSCPNFPVSAARHHPFPSWSADYHHS